IPLGATVNMDGTAIMQGVATLFVAQAYGIHFGLKEYVMVILTATLASIGTAGVPGVGLVMLAMVFQQVGLPLEAIGIIMAVDRPLDMARTVVNVTGDGVVSCVVAKSEKELDFNTYESE
ncbi:dicarboxylate/amino acid:cation symporter, partial [bacterium]|nr:dicarboxylate/amino acid:cation symporter [bacterium]